MTKIETESLEVMFTNQSVLELFYRHYASQEAGAPVLCLHGFMRNSRDFEELAPRLAVGRRVIAPDLRGPGRSARMTNVGDYDFDLVIENMWQLLDHLNIERMEIIGTTFGGLMAIEMAGEEPERVAGIVVNGIGAQIPLPALKRMAGHAESADYSFEEAVARVKEHNEAIYPGFGKDDWVCLMLRAYREIRPGQYARDFALLTMRESARMQTERPEYWHEFSKASTVPVVLIRGELSDLLTDDIAQHMVEMNSAAIITAVADRGHPPLLNEPQSLAVNRRAFKACRQTGLIG